MLNFPKQQLIILPRNSVKINDILITNAKNKTTRQVIYINTKLNLQQKKNDKPIIKVLEKKIEEIWVNMKKELAKEILALFCNLKHMAHREKDKVPNEGNQTDGSRCDFLGNNSLIVSVFEPIPFHTLPPVDAIDLMRDRSRVC